MVLKAVTYFDKKLHHFKWVLNTPLLMVVAGYRDNLFNKTKVLFSVLAKKTQSILFLDSYGSTYDMNDGLNKKMYSCLKNQVEKTTAVE